MGNERWSDDIPPVPHLSTVAQGVSDGGERWTVQAGGTRAQCWTFMEIELPDGRRVGGGGFAGPALPVGRHLNCSVHRSGTDIHYIVGRIHPAVKRLHLEFANHATKLDLRPVGKLVELDIAFVAEILPVSAELINISAWDESGRRVDEQSTANTGAFFNQARSGSPAGPAIDQHNGDENPVDHHSS
jgi:hypothetical protein